jgi:hypothetical protein
MQKIVRLDTLINNYFTTDSNVFVFLITETVISIDLIMDKNYTKSLYEPELQYYVPSDVILIDSNKM